MATVNLTQLVLDFLTKRINSTQRFVFKKVSATHFHASGLDAKSHLLVAALFSAEVRAVYA